MAHPAVGTSIGGNVLAVLGLEAGKEVGLLPTRATVFMDFIADVFSRTPAFGGTAKPVGNIPD